MLQKIIPIILIIGFITQTFALSGDTLDFIEMLLTNPFILFTVAPFIIGAGLVILVQIFIQFGKLSSDCFKSDEETWEQEEAGEI